MGLLIDHRGADFVDRWSNLAFYRKTTRRAFDAIVDAVDPTQQYVMYGFQVDDAATMLGVTNEGRSSVLANLAMSHGSMWSGSGFYRAHGNMLQAGNKGQGINSVGGASTYLLSCATHNGTYLQSHTKATFLYKFIMRGTGGAGAGRLSEADASHICFASAANTIAMSIYNHDVLAWASNSTGATVTYDVPHDLAVVVDTTLAGDANICKLYLDGRDVTTVVTAGMPTGTLWDSSTILRILNGFVGGVYSRAFDGILGFFALIPGVAMSQAQIQSFIETSAHFQPTAADQPAIYAPGSWPTPENNFILAEDDHLYANQVQPLLTQAGSIMVAFIPEDFTNQQTLFGLSQEGAAVWHSLAIQLRGDVANDPIELIGYTAGAADLRLSIPFGAGNLGVPSILWLTSDGTTVRGYLNGREQVVTADLGANTGQWFADYPLSTVACIGGMRRDAIIEELDGRIAVVQAFDREVAYIDIQRQWAQGWGQRGPRLLFDR